MVGEDTLQPRVGRKHAQLPRLMAGLPSNGQQVVHLGHLGRFGWGVGSEEGAARCTSGPQETAGKLELL